MGEGQWGSGGATRGSVGGVSVGGASVSRGYQCGWGSMGGQCGRDQWVCGWGHMEKYGERPQGST